MLKSAVRVVSAALAIAGIAVALSLASPAQAAWEGEIGSRAFTNHALPLYTGPGENRGLVGTLPGGLELRVDQCRVLWCEVHGRFGRGWVFLYSLSFGQGPNSIWWPADERHPETHRRTW